MVYLLTLFTSFFIQFGALERPVVMNNVVDCNTLAALINNYSSSPNMAKYWADSFDKLQTIVTYYQAENASYSYYMIMYNAKAFNSAYGDLTYNLNSYNINNDLLNLDINFNNYCVFSFVYNKGSNKIQFYNNQGTYNTGFYNLMSYGTNIIQNSRNPILAAYGLVIQDSQGVVCMSSDMFVDNVVHFDGLGSMSATGHSSDDSPFDSINNNSFNWASVSGHSSGGTHSPSPHSSSTHYSSTTPSPDTSDSKTDSLLYMIGNKLADITENTGSIGDILGGVMYNQIQGASAIFNAISGLNDNLQGVFTPPTKEEFQETLETSEIYASYQNISTAICTMTSTLNNVGQQSNYVWTIPLPDSWGGDLSFNFSDYISPTDLNSVRILIAAILIISTIIFVAHQLPDIVGGGSGGENA